MKSEAHNVKYKTAKSEAHNVEYKTVNSEAHNVEYKTVKSEVYNVEYKTVKSEVNYTESKAISILKSILDIKPNSFFFRYVFVSMLRGYKYTQKPQEREKGPYNLI